MSKKHIQNAASTATIPLLDSAIAHEADQSSSSSETPTELAASQSLALSPNPCIQPPSQKDKHWSGATWESPLPAEKAKSHMHRPMRALLQHELYMQSYPSF